MSPMNGVPSNPPKGLSGSGLLFSLIANLIPIGGVIWLGWDAIQLLFLFWTESLIVGVFTYHRVRMAQGDRPAGPWLTGTDRAEGFFALHYGIFWFVHGVILIAFTMAFAELGGPAALWGSVVGSVDFWLAVLAVAISHAMAFWYGWMKPQAWRNASPGRELFRPYGRLLALHMVMTLGLGVMISSGGDSTVVILILCIVKAIFDLIFEALFGRGPRRRHA